MYTGESPQASFFDIENTFMGTRLRISFQRTLLLPEKDQTWALPAGLGTFPLHSVAHYEDRLTEEMSLKADCSCRCTVS